MQRLSLVSLIFSLVFLFYSCGDSQNQENETVEEISEEVNEEVNIENEVEYLLPSPLQIVEIFKRSNLHYVGDLTNPKENINKYNSKYDQKINFGIYSADMAYCVINKQSQQAIDYLNTLRQLSEKLWLTDVFNTLGLRDRLESNVENEDSMTYVMADLQIQMDDYLQENGESNIAPVIFAGAWIETMYLGAKVNKLERNEKLIFRLSEQAIILNDLIKSIKQVNSGNDYDELIADLESISGLFGDLADEDSEDITILDDEQIEKLSTAIVSLRSKIIGE